MRLTNKLYAQHIGWMFKKHWQVQGKRVPRASGALAELEKFGITVKDANEVAEPQKELQRFDIPRANLESLVENEAHPHWHQKVCHMYGNENVLLEGLPQAQLLTKTIEINSFPRNIEESLSRMQLSSAVDRIVQHSIMAALVYDAEQVKLPKVKLTNRPAYNLPRNYGISYERGNRLLINKLLSECEKLAGRSVTSRRRLMDGANFCVTLPRDDDLLQFNVNAEKIMTSVRPIEPVKGKYDGEIPVLYPLKCIISMPKQHIYTTDTFYPLSKTTNSSNPHTIFLHFNKELVGNLHDSSVKATQFQSRTMLKAFTVAAARAKQLYGEAAMETIPRPIVVQSIQTDGCTFHFGVFQLNTLKLDGSDGLKNYWFHQENLDLFKECGYTTGKPHLEGYNKDVFRYLNAFYNNS